jgi:hypothetical protein
MEKAAKFRERAQRFEERAATEVDPEAREQWQRVADAWHSAAGGGSENTPADLGVAIGCDDHDALGGAAPDLARGQFRCWPARHPS